MPCPANRFSWLLQNGPVTVSSSQTASTNGRASHQSQQQRLETSPGCQLESATWTCEQMVWMPVQGPCGTQCFYPRSNHGRFLVWFASVDHEMQDVSSPQAKTVARRFSGLQTVWSHDPRSVPKPCLSLPQAPWPQQPQQLFPEATSPAVPVRRTFFRRNTTSNLVHPISNPFQFPLFCSFLMSKMRWLVAAPTVPRLHCLCRSARPLNGAPAAAELL